MKTSSPLHTSFGNTLAGFTLSVLLSLSAHTVMAAPLASDGFATTTDGAGGTYSTTGGVGGSDGRLYGQDATTSVVGFSGAWTNGTPLTTAGIRVETGGLTHSLLQGAAAAGDVYHTDGTGRTVNRAFSTDVLDAISNAHDNNGELWYSGLVRSGQDVGTRPILFGLSANVRHDVPLNSDPLGVSFGFDDGSIRLYIDGVQTGGSGFKATVGTTYLVAVKIDFGAEPFSDSVTLHIWDSDATLADVNTPLATISTEANLSLDLANLSYLTISGQTSVSEYSSDATTPRFDEFRLGLSQSDVMVVPEPSLVGLTAAAAGLLACGFRRRRQS
jgi:hypothetical protein